VVCSCEVPPTMLNIIQSFHDGMEASVRVRDTVTDILKLGMAYKRDVPWCLLS